jgi:D-alanyl-lipoteichoic acid acyltransferase DltB (MBOAT superfamily)
MSQTSVSPAVTMDAADDSASTAGSKLQPLRTTRQWARFGAVVLQLGLLVGLFKLFAIENPALFDRIGPLALVGFVLHHLLPQRMRLGFFALLSVVSVFAVFAGPRGGPTVLGFSIAGLEASAWLLGLGGALIAACHVPAPHAVRCGLVFAIGAVLALMRGKWVLSTGAISVPSAIWPILGSMFMFRLVVYLYDLKHGGVPVGPGHAIGYFFMLPNVLFTLFPVVDYKTFCRSHYNDDPFRIYQVGLRWMIRGVVQLLVYRHVYNNYIIDPGSVTTALEAGQYILSTFLLYLKLSGTFHLIVGLLHLFGFNLPETQHMYFLSHSFTDFWRRINIYWKDFIQKVVFYPLWFRLKPLGKWAIPVCTVLAFLATWLLHSYQWFWIRSNFPIAWHDFAFWMGLAILVVINTQWEQRKGRRRVISTPERTLRTEVLHGLSAAGTFVAISLLWTLWSTPDVDELKTLGSALASMSARDAGVFSVVALLVGSAAVLTRGKTREHTEGARSGDKRGKFPFWLYAGEVLAVGGIIGFAGYRPELLNSMPHVKETIVELKANKLNRQDIAGLERGYYEDLGDVTRFSSQLGQAMGGQPRGWNTNKARRDRKDLLAFDLRPSTQVKFKGATFTTNSLGMRDREYKREKRPGTYRIVLVGSSHDYGAGVRDEETYENICEDRLNRERVGTAISGYEILNLSCGGYGPLQKLMAVEMKGLAYDPDLVIYAANHTELSWVAKLFDRLMKRSDGEVAKYFSPVLTAAGVTPEDPQSIIEKKTAAHREALLRLVYERFARSVKARGSRAAVALLPTPSDPEKTPPEVDRIVSLAGDAGLPVVELWGAFDAVPDRSTLWIAPWDDHANAKAHALLADRLFERLVASGILPDPGRREDSGR